jgi:hypothetical protein
MRASRRAHGPPADRGTHLPWFAASDFPAPTRRSKAALCNAQHSGSVVFSLLLSRVVEVLLLTFFFNVRKIDFHIQFSNIVSEKESYKSLSHTSILFKASRKIEYGNFQT